MPTPRPAHRDRATRRRRRGSPGRLRRFLGNRPGWRRSRSAQSLIPAGFPPVGHDHAADVRVSRRHGVFESLVAGHAYLVYCRTEGSADVQTAADRATSPGPGTSRSGPGARPDSAGPRAHSPRSGSRAAASSRACTAAVPVPSRTGVTFSSRQRKAMTAERRWTCGCSQPVPTSHCCGSAEGHGCADARGYPRRRPPPAEDRPTVRDSERADRDPCRGTNVRTERGRGSHGGWPGQGVDRADVGS